MSVHPSLQFRSGCLLVMLFCTGVISIIACGDELDEDGELAVTATSTVDYTTETDKQGGIKTTTIVALSRETDHETSSLVSTSEPEDSDELKVQVPRLSRGQEVNESDTIRWINDIYDGLPEKLKSTLLQDGFDRTAFESIVFSLIGENVPEFDRASRLFRSFATHPVDFLPLEFWDLVLSLAIKPVATESTPFDPKNLTNYSTGTSYPTGQEAAEIMMMLNQIVLEESFQTADDIVLPTSEEIEGFFSSLPDDVKTTIESDGWTEERVNQISDSSEPLNLLEVRSLLALLGDVPIPFLQDETMGLLAQLPGFLTAEIADGLGQEAHDELKYGVRPPTGTEFVVLIDSLEAIGLPGK